MIRSLYTASTGMYAQQLNVDNIAHNMSNVNTNGFKKSRVEFQDLLYQTIRQPAQAANSDTIPPTGIIVGLGVKPSAIYSVYSQGNMINTNLPTDVAIAGDGFFQVEVPGYPEPVYSRDGAIKIDAQGNMTTADGYKYLGAEQLPQGSYDIAIHKDGKITYRTAEDPNTVLEGGQLILSKFMNPAGLEKLGTNLFNRSANSGEPVEWDPESDASTHLEAGYLEGSNVQIVEEMVNLITAQRAYDTNSKVIQASDEMLQTAVSLRR
ncbi:MAG: flagellar basal-body rod protein FlgG [Methylocystaceae bacterium]